MPCGCCQGACCYCVRGFHYYAYATDPNGGTAYQDRTLGGLSPPAGESWDCQDLYDVDGVNVWVPGNSSAPEGGTFLNTKFCTTGSFACRFADWIWDNAEDTGASPPYYSAWTRDDEYTACVQTNRGDCEQCRETVDDPELLQDKCGFFSPGLTCVGGPPVPWPNGSETCACCASLVADPYILALYQADWESNWSQRWDAIKTLLEAAGWTVTINVTPYEDNGEQFVSVSMDLSSDCCFDCAALYDAAVESQNNNGAITGQPAGLWVDVRGDEMNDYGLGPIAFGYFHMTGCCDLFAELNNGIFRAPTSVNGEGDNLSTWIPSPNAYCNPLP